MFGVVLAKEKRGLGVLGLGFRVELKEVLFRGFLKVPLAGWQKKKGSCKSLEFRVRELLSFEGSKNCHMT